jgi:uncharacterized protein YjbI with pentapeptide repeats
MYFGGEVLNGASIDLARLINADLTGASFFDADLMSAQISGQLGRAIFEDAYLLGTNFGPRVSAHARQTELTENRQVLFPIS